MTLAHRGARLGGTGPNAPMPSHGFQGMSGNHSRITYRTLNIAPSRRGHGRPDGEGWIPMDAFAGCGDVAATFIAGGPVVGVGHSMGGYGAAYGGARTAGVFRGLVLYEPRDGS